MGHWIQNLKYFCDLFWRPFPEEKPAAEPDLSTRVAGEETPQQSEPADDLKDLPPKQTLGKGKRARIPNKRYSDIVISPRQNHTSDTEKTTKKNAVENGVPQEKENLNTDKAG